MYNVVKVESFCYYEESVMSKYPQKFQTFFSSVILGTASFAGFAASDTVDCYSDPNKQKPYPVTAKTITIQNNTDGVIYPVIQSGSRPVDEWLQGCFRSTDNFPQPKNIRAYINFEKGLSKGQSVTVSLPVYSQTDSDGYVTWWNGGRIYFGDTKGSEGSGLQLMYTKDSANKVTVSGDKAQINCSDCTSLEVFSSTEGIDESLPGQLAEFTFGDSPAANVPRKLFPENVNYNVSYVDHVYLPVAIGPKGNPYIGYTGTTENFKSFREKLGTFFADPQSGKGWPAYNLAGLTDEQLSQNKIKIPGGYNIFALRTDTQSPTIVPLPRVVRSDGFPPTITLPKCLKSPESCTEEEKQGIGGALQNIQNLWKACAGDESFFGKKDASAVINCSFKTREDRNPLVGPTLNQQTFKQVYQFFLKNYNKYKSGACGNNNLKANLPPLVMLQHIYGFVPFNEGCNNAGYNALVDTSTKDEYEEAHRNYIELQYSTPTDKTTPHFNPYVNLIHDRLKTNAYAFSIDDAVGFMAEYGSGLIFTLGDAAGLENKDPFSFKTGFTVATPDLGKPSLIQYRACVIPEGQSDVECSLDGEAASKYTVSYVTDTKIPTFKTNTVIPTFKIGTLLNPQGIKDPAVKVVYQAVSAKGKIRTYSFIAKPSKFEDCPAGSVNCTPVVDIKSSCKVDGQYNEAWCVGITPNRDHSTPTKNIISVRAPIE